MHEQAKLIVKYQDVDKKLKAIEDELNTSEEAKKYFVARKFLSTVKDSLLELDQKAKTVTENYNASLAEAQKLINEAKKFENAIDSCESEGELISLKKKFQDAVDKIAQMESKIASLSKEMNELYKEFSELGKKNKLMKAQYDEYSPKLEELKNSKKEEVLALRSELKKIEAKIDADLMNKYAAKRKDKVFPIVFGYDVQSKAAYCPHCATGMSIGFVNALNAGEVKECESCHRLIYAFDSTK